MMEHNAQLQDYSKYRDAAVSLKALGIRMTPNDPAKLEDHTGVEIHFGVASGNLVMLDVGDGDLNDLGDFSGQKWPRTALFKIGDRQMRFYRSSVPLYDCRISHHGYVRGEGSVVLDIDGEWLVPASEGVAAFPAALEEFFKEPIEIQHERARAKRNRDHGIGPSEAEKTLPKAAVHMVDEPKQPKKGRNGKLFGQVPQWVTRSEGENPSVWGKLPRRAQAVYIALVGRAHYNSRICFPSQRLIMRESGIKKASNISSATKLLVEMGLIRKETKQLRLNKRSTTYRILEDPPNTP